MEEYIKYFKEIELTDLFKVSGKNASLGEMFQKISGKGIAVPDYPGYARFLVNAGINSISFNPDALLSIIDNIHEAEKNVSPDKINSI